MKPLNNAGLIALLAVLMLCATPPNALGQAKKPEKAGAAKTSGSSESSAPSSGSFRCQLNVFYEWKRLPPKPPPPEKGKGRGAVPAKPPEITPEEVAFETLAEEAGTQEAATAALQRVIPTLQQNARAECVRRHQDLAGCIISGMKEIGLNYQQYDYTTRKKFLDALSTDCESTMGVCTGVRVSEITCVAQTKTEGAPETNATPPAAEEKPGAKK